MTSEQAKNEVKRHLWLWGFKLKDVSGLCPFNFLMSDGKRVKVVIGKSKKSLSHFKVRTNIDCDILAVAIEDKNGRPKKFYSAGVRRGPEKYLYFDKFKATPKGVI
jgi:hypothetical protein